MKFPSRRAKRKAIARARAKQHARRQSPRHATPPAGLAPLEPRMLMSTVVDGPIDFSPTATESFISVPAVLTAGAEFSESAQVAANTAHSSGPSPLQDFVAGLTFTHQAVNSGSWSDPATWGDAGVPNSLTDRVEIPSGATVTYDATHSADNSEGVYAIVVQSGGTLNFKVDQPDTVLRLDTLAVMHGGTLEIGTEDNPVQGSNTVNIQFIADNAINFNNDVHAISRGLISEGTVRMFGESRTHRATLSEATAGSTTLTFDQSIADWKIGDKIVLAGTFVDPDTLAKNYNPEGDELDATNDRFHDEELTIETISDDGRTITFKNLHDNSNALRFDHEPPQEYASTHDLKVYAGNLTRNIVLETEGWDGIAPPESQLRGHVMFTGDSTTNINHVAFNGLGRTDKTKDVTDPNGGQSVSADYENVRGRYAVHFHQVDNLGKDENGDWKDAGRIEGSVVDTSSGWGFAIHSSKANIVDSVSFNVVGAHFFTEEGDEKGSFVNNLAIKATGSDGFTGSDGQPGRNVSAFANGRVIEPNRSNAFSTSDNHDFGIAGNGFWIQNGGNFTINGNVAASTHGPAFEIYGDADDNLDLRNELSLAQVFEVNDEGVVGAGNNQDVYDNLVLAYGETALAHQIPWNSFADNKAFNTFAGLQYSWILRDIESPAAPSTSGDGATLASNIRSSESNRILSNVRNELVGFEVYNHYGTISNEGGSVRSGSAISIAYGSRLDVTGARLFGGFNTPDSTTGATDVEDPHKNNGAEDSLDRVRVGIDVNYNVRSIVVTNATVLGFDQGVAIPFTGNEREGRGEVVLENRIDGGTFNNRANLVPGERLEEFPFEDPTFIVGAAPLPAGHLLGTPEGDPTYSYLEFGEIPTFLSPEVNNAPVADFEFDPADGFAIRFNGSLSSDRSDDTTYIGGNEIAAYGWDFGEDQLGTIDAWGENPVHTFDEPGTYNVTLTVWDSAGATHELTRQVVLTTPTPVNAVADPMFSNELVGLTPDPTTRVALAFPEQWIVGSVRNSVSWETEDGILRRIVGEPDSNTQAIQVIDNRGAHRGLQEVSFGHISTDANSSGNNTLGLKIWGINAEDAYFSVNPNFNFEPDQFGAFDFDRHLIHDTGNVLNGNSTWTPYAEIVDFGNEGYDYLVVSFQTNTQLVPGDQIAIKDVSIQRHISDQDDLNAPNQEANNLLVVDANTPQVITSDDLRYSDATAVNYTVTAAPTNGQIQLNGTATSTFTQAQIDNDEVTYVSDETVGDDSFTFVVSDGSNSTANVTFNINVQAVTNTGGEDAYEDNDLSSDAAVIAGAFGSLSERDGLATGTDGDWYRFDDVAGEFTVTLESVHAEGALNVEIYDSNTLSYLTGNYGNQDRSSATVDVAEGSGVLVFVYAPGGAYQGNTYDLEWTSTTPPPAQPATPTATAGDGQVELAWTLVPGATSYNVEFADGTQNFTLFNPNNTPAVTIDGEIGRITVDNLNNGTEYSFRVTAVNEAGESLPSMAVSATPESDTQTTPSDPATVTFDELTNPNGLFLGNTYVDQDSGFRFFNPTIGKHLVTTTPSSGAGVAIHTSNWNSVTEITLNQGETFDFTSFDASTLNGQSQHTIVRVVGYPAEGTQIQEVEFTVGSANLSTQMIGFADVNRVEIQLGNDNNEFGRPIEMDNFVFGQVSGQSSAAELLSDNGFDAALADFPDGGIQWVAGEDDASLNQWIALQANNSQSSSINASDQLVAGRGTTIGTFQAIEAPPAGSPLTISFDYQQDSNAATSPPIFEVYGMNDGGTVAKFGHNVITGATSLLQEVFVGAPGSLTPYESVLTVDDEYDYFIISLKSGVFDNVSIVG